MGRPIIVSPGWRGVLPEGAFKRYGFVEPVQPEPQKEDDDEKVVIEED
jgi:hypothetical protein